MSAEAIDLTVLSRHGASMDATTSTAVPMPASRWKTRVLLPGAILVSVLGMLAYSARDALLPATLVKVVPVVVKSGVAGGGAVTVQAPGWVEAAPFGYAVSALADGIVKEVLVLEGEAVKAGQVMARLVDDDARLALAGANADVAEKAAAAQTAEAALNAAQRTWDNPIEMTRGAQTAEAMLAEKKADLERWPMEVAADEARALELKTEFERVAGLRDREQASSIELVRAQQQYEAQNATAGANRARKPIIEAQIRRAEAELTAAKDNLRLRIAEALALESARAELAVAKAALEGSKAAGQEAQLRLERMEVRCPVDGVVAARLVAPGSKVMLNDNMRDSAQIARVYDPAKLQVRVDVPLADAASVAVGQEAEIVVGVLPDRTFRGRLTRFVNEADVQKNTLQVKVSIDDPSPELKPEMLARVKFLGQTIRDGRMDSQRVFAPEELIRRHAGGHVESWIVDQTRNRAEVRTITLGTAKLGNWIEIREGLQPGDQLIAGDTSRLRPGQRVRITGEAEDVREPAKEGASHGAH